MGPAKRNDDGIFRNLKGCSLKMIRKNELKIVSGGQTGADRGGLLAAMDLGLDWGGWAPKGWRSEDGTIPSCYREKMQEIGSSNYLVRTRRNVADSHATLIVTNTYPLSGGTLKTRHFCEEMMRSHLVVAIDENDAVGKVQRWLAQFFEQNLPIPFVLNVAGPRESKASGIQKASRKLLVQAIGEADILVSSSEKGIQEVS
jgi:hypothetical protein